MIPADITFVALFPSNHWLFIENIVLDDSAISELEKPWQLWKWEKEKVVLITGGPDVVCVTEWIY